MDSVMKKANHIRESSYDDLLFDNVNNINQDQDFWFQLRGNSINLFIDAATPLLGMALRIRHLGSCDNIEAIYHQAVEEIKAIDVELTEADHEHAVILAYRYILCSFIDEAVMSTSWGADSAWAEHSLLTRFHNETWGGEKVFSVLSRLEAEPERYQELLMFIYLCLTLGFEGRYKVMNNGKEAFDKVIANLYEILRRLKDKEPQALTFATEHVAAKKYKLTKQIPLWTIFSGFSLSWIVIFIVYSVLLNNKSIDVLTQLNHILQ
ncbi:type IVB secretion system protein IcmH/DotU [Photobacterium iliopiscarium]|jgi:type VI secretion system protein ImpK|uniref:type IVB secretion system protein IcmH/DotU n=1 Tax=Photobacterium iliopiscarium TaxID=56192 RepID=UPI0005D303FF|nr:type IVB secretion system protein IcmH/DotU [Photobacterium iliopiscarium]KJG12838.1 type IV secretion protein DotU [Photobacterium iliopiscarium]